MRSLIYIGDSLKREFYLEMCHSEGWNTRTLQGSLDFMLFEPALAPHLLRGYKDRTLRDRPRDRRPAAIFQPGRIRAIAAICDPRFD